MSIKRKISPRKVLQVLITVIASSVCITALLSAAHIQEKKVVNRVYIHITNENKCKFIDREQVAELLFRNRHVEAMGIPVSKLDIRHMESIAQANPWIADAQVYVDNKKDLQIYITQRVPVVRVFEATGNSYYLDTSLKIMPLSEKYVDYDFVVTNVPELKEDSLSIAIKKQILTLVRFIKGNSFWNTQTEQIYVNSDNSFELIPVLGNHRILLGDTSLLKEKFDNLFAFYTNVMNKIGWDKYEVIDVRYKGQVVASPSLPWKGPKDLAMNNMSWVKSIIGTESNDSAKNISTNSLPVDASVKSIDSTVKKKVIPIKKKEASTTKKTDNKKTQKKDNKKNAKTNKNK